jgi:hypothetical protein
VGTVTPSSGTSPANQSLSFTTTFSDLDGYANIQSALLLMNTSINGTYCFYGNYNQNLNKLYLLNDAGTAWLGGFAPGSSNTIENSYAKIDCAKTTVTGDGNNLTVNWQVTFKRPFIGTKNSYLCVYDKSNAYAGWTPKGSFTITNPLSLGAVTPASGASTTNQPLSFTTTFTDTDGWQAIQYVLFAINTPSLNNFYGYYNQNQNKVYLINDAGTAWLGGFAPGSPNIIENSYAKLDCAKTTVTGDGNNLTVNWALSFKANSMAVLGDKKSWLFLIDDAGNSINWTQKGTWTLTNPLSIDSLTPSSGALPANQPASFTTVFSDTDGYQNLQYCLFLINTSVYGVNCFYGYYNPQLNKLYLMNDAGTAWLGGFAPGSNNIIENSYAKIDCSKTTVSGSGPTLTINWSVTFKSTFLGNKNAYLCLYDKNNLYVNWLQKGTWTVNTPLSIDDLTPASGTLAINQPNNFTTIFSDTDGYQSLQYCLFLINTSINPSQCFYGYYNQNLNKLYLMNDAGNAWLGGYTPGTNQTIENSYAKLNCAQTTITSQGSNLTVNWQVSFKSTFMGNKNAYLSAWDDYGRSTSWQQKASYTIANQILSLSVNPKSWEMGSTQVNKVVTMDSVDKITVTNNGTVPETFELTLVNPSGWSAANSPGQNTYVLSAVFCNLNNVAQEQHFNQDGSFEDVITPVAKKATSAIFGYSQDNANAVAVPQGEARALYLQFKSPTNTDKTAAQNISVMINCQSP